jgi:hypothetical protein
MRTRTRDGVGAARSQLTIAPVNNDSETASYTAPSSSIAKCSSAGSTLPAGRDQSNTGLDSAEDAQPPTTTRQVVREFLREVRARDGREEMWRRVRSGLASIWSVRC